MKKMPTPKASDMAIMPHSILPPKASSAAAADCSATVRGAAGAPSPAPFAPAGPPAAAVFASASSSSSSAMATDAE